MNTVKINYDGMYDLIPNGDSVTANLKNSPYHDKHAVYWETNATFDKDDIYFFNIKVNKYLSVNYKHKTQPCLRAERTNFQIRRFNEKGFLIGFKPDIEEMSFGDVFHDIIPSLYLSVKKQIVSMNILWVNYSYIEKEIELPRFIWRLE
ncbi:hypothetical protein [Xenorhabdus sp. BG5]|uniref:hypothetical protein n=1 Tax=Xenorhabdus sp. BG5 TaxID=2782014 RepID=UPI00187DE6E5|nr:hypothetical protein [Xenorhabdus sp. BG5]MBE8596535.1 hypothetical protein [Xenorhabdus sp. BG5]